MDIFEGIEIVTENIMEGGGLKNFLESSFPNCPVFLYSFDSLLQVSIQENKKLKIIDIDNHKNEDLEKIRRRNKCIVYSQTNSPGLLMKCKKLLISGYVSKKSSSNCILNCIKVINLGGTYYDSCFSEILGKVSEFEKQLSLTQIGVFNRVLLNPDWSISEIAQDMEMSKHTLEVHLSNIYQKAEVNSFSELVSLFSL